MRFNSCFLSVVIPAFNEAKRIGKTLKHTLAYLDKQNYTWELILVDDGSQDQTIAVIESIVRNMPNIQILSYHPNAGKGKAVRTGICASSGEYVLFMDADNSTPVDEVENGLPLIQEHQYDLAIGSRALDSSRITASQPMYRRVSAWIFKQLYRMIVGIRSIEDTQCGFKLFRGDMARWLFSHQRIDGYMFDIETLYLAHKLGFTIKEFPVSWENDPDSRLRLVYDTVRMFKHLLLIRMRPLKVLRAARPS